MANYVTLMGAEDVQRAGRAIVGAADTMQRTAASIDESFNRFLQRFEELVIRMEQAKEDPND